LCRHLGILEAVNLVSTVQRGREKLHYLNPAPLEDVRTRWISKFEQPRLAALNALKNEAEAGMGSRPAFVHVIYIESTAERVWEALTDPDMTAAYWGHSNVSDWQEGSAWERRWTGDSRTADVVGTVVESRPPRRLVTTWASPGEQDGPEPSRVAFTIEPHEGIVRLTVTHENLPDEAERNEIAGGGAAVLSNLKSLFETGRGLPAVPWEMPLRSSFESGRLRPRPSNHVK
jgi:uncharacterized protein YndB with AHSA1/START domain